MALQGDIIYSYPINEAQKVAPFIRGLRAAAATRVTHTNEGAILSGTVPRLFLFKIVGELRISIRVTLPCTIAIGINCINCFFLQNITK